ncbi:MAG: lysophospholipase [Bacteroidales bacterium]|nr:lysophospholipase [Bacteroidales bacterium]MCM1414681.1 lysophospholipase [bacterium]MCM1422370.1 lysophospholipase [bacterium]
MRKKIRIASAVLAALLTVYTVFVYFLVSACLVPSFMDRLTAFEEITKKCYSEQVQTVQLQDNQSRLLSETAKWLKTVKREKIYAETPDGYRLAAEVFPERTSETWVLLLHGYTGWKEEMYQFACWYQAQGYAVLAPDLRCQGESEGDFIGMGWTDHYDCQLWIEQILRESPEAKIILHGQSMGAATALILAGSPERTPHIAAVVADSAYTEAYEMFADKITEWFHLPAALFVDSACVMLKLRGGYDLRDASPLRAVQNSNVPTLFIHGEEDRMIDAAMSCELYEAASCEKELFIVEGAGHAQTQDKDPEAYYGKIGEFLTRYL